ncbi:MAG: ATP-binding protein [Bacteroidota bacterium]
MEAEMHAPGQLPLSNEIEILRARLEEAEELIHAIRNGTIDALAVQGPEGPRIFTLKDSNHAYRTLIEEMNEGAITLDQKAVILYSNACFANLVNRGLEQVIGSSFYDFIPTAFQSQFEELFQMGWTGKSKGEIPLKSGTGVLLPFSMAMSALQFDDIPVVGVVLTDLSAQKEIQAIKNLVDIQNAIIDKKNEELKYQEIARKEAEQQRLLMDAMPQIAWISEPDGSVSNLNRRWYDYTGADFNPTSWTWSDFIHPEDMHLTFTRWQHSLDTGDIYEIEYRLRAANGVYRWMLGRTVPIKNKSGKITIWVGTATDIHDYKVMLEELALAKQQLSTKNEELNKTNVDLDNFVYTASHDLKSPVATLQGFITYLSKRLTGRLDEKESKIMEMVQHSTDKLLNTIRDLTEITKVQKDSYLEKEMISFHELFDDVKTDLTTLITKVGTVFIVDFQVEGIIYARKNLRSILYNLLSNAVKYHSQRPSKVYVSTYVQNGNTVLVINDNGLGLKPVQLTKVFTMFKRFHDHVEGSGIGLYMIKRMIENNGGRIEVVSEEGQGSTFTVYFQN